MSRSACPIESEVGENHPKASSISAIDKGSVHKICSGQVVLTLATAVKELVENSIDAGATIVDIKLREHGSEAIEVSDNGVGVEEENFQGLTLKHHTSKLQDFADLVNVETFGFRGEALSSLCALGDMCITTKHQSSSVGTWLKFNHHGNITTRTPQARQVGTTVVIQNLFSTLPVRHKEFQRNIKKEFARMVQVLNSYCLISTGVRITCTNQTGKGNRSTVISTKGNSTLRENIANIFGPKQLQSLMEFQQRSPGEDVCTEFGVKKQENDIFRLEGYISLCAHGMGRSSTDRQFFFINGRPFDSSKLSKVVNETYHQYNRHQYPFVSLIVNMEKESVDVNVTPDKRQVFLEGEKMILAVVKSSLTAMFEPTTSVLQLQLPGSFLKSGTEAKLQNQEEKFSPRKTQSLSALKDTGLSSLMKLKRSFSSAFAKDNNNSQSEASDSKADMTTKQRKLDSFVTSMPKEESDFISNNSQKDGCHIAAPVTDNNIIVIENDTISSDSGVSLGNLSESCSASSQETIFSHEDVSTDKSISIVYHSEPEAESVDGDLKSRALGDENMRNISETNISTNGVDKYDKIQLKRTSGICLESDLNDVNHLQKYREVNTSYSEENVTDTDHIHKPVSELNNNLGISAVDSPDDLRVSQLTSTASDSVREQDGDVSDTNDNEGACAIIQHEIDEKLAVDKKEQRISFSMHRLRDNLKRKQEREDVSKECFKRNFRATISPTDNLAAEQELQKEIKKEMFKEMEILGQFNLGFIITKLNEDLFIVDQHATDEKFNFETLRRDTVIQSQKLICPLNLELTASNETILMDNLEIFKKNGFDFVIDEQGLPTQRVKLMSTPVSKNWNFGKEDIEEMIFMLTDSPGVTCRPTRVRQMFASRACRKSIMIGTALSKAEMRKLVCHMGEIEQPWNCPHGRPTMRHLINLRMIPR